MKIYLFLSTITYVFISFLFELTLSTDTGNATIVGIRWLLSSEQFGISNVTTYTLQGAVLSFAACIYIQPKTTLVDGFRFGLISGLVYVMVILFNMMIHLNHAMYPFFMESLLQLVLKQLVGFTVIGWLFGYFNKIFLQKHKSQPPFSFY